MRRIKVDDADLAVDVRGSGAPVLLLHGFTGSAGTWDATIAALADGRRTIAPDLLGHGRSDAPADPARYGLERQAQGLALLLEALDAVPAAVVGYSMGARLALTLAVTAPRVVERLVVLSPSAGIADERERARRRASDEELSTLLEQEGIDAFVDAWESQALFASHARRSVEDRASLRRERLGHDPVGLAASLRGAGQGAMTPLHARLGAVACPALVVAGALDPVGLARAHEVADGIRGARLEVIADAGHAPHLERADVFADLAAAFLAAPSAIPSHARS